MKADVVAETMVQGDAACGVTLDHFLSGDGEPGERFRLAEQLARREAEEEASRRRVREALERRAREGLAFA